MRKKEREEYEIIIPQGYDVEDMLDMDDDFEEPPIKTEEVTLRYE